MLMSEEEKVLEYLTQHRSAPVAEVAQACLSGASPEWLDRVVTNLDWLSYIAVLRGPQGEPLTLQITERGLEKFARTQA